MVMHIVIPPAPAPDDEPPRPWPPEDARYNVLTDPRVSIPIKVWALLHVEPHTMADLCDFLGARPQNVYAGNEGLRKHGQRVMRKGLVYRLEPSPPLQVSHVPERGLILRPGNRRFDRVWFQIVCTVIHGVPRIEVLDPPSPPQAELRQSSGRYPAWRPSRGDYAASEGLQPRSVAIWVWGLLKGGAWTRAQLAEELRVHPSQIAAAISELRGRGHRVECDTWDRYFIGDDGLPIRVFEYEGGLRLARKDGHTGGRDFDLW